MNTGINEVKKLFAEKKFGEAVALLKDLAEQENDPEAKFYLGTLHIKGAAGVPKDIEAGKKYLMQAADAGLENAKQLLATMGVKQATPLTANEKQITQHDSMEQKGKVAEPLKEDDKRVIASGTDSVGNKKDAALLSEQGTASETLLSSAKSAGMKIMNASKNAYETSKNAYEEANQKSIQDKSLVRLSREKAGMGDMVINVFGAMVVLMILFRFVSSIFEPPRSNIRQQQPGMAQGQMVNTKNNNVVPVKPGAPVQDAMKTQQNTNTGSAAEPISVIGAYHSSADQEGNYLHSAKLAVDGNTSTCWSEGVRGLGIGENIEIHFNGNYKVNGMNIWIGHQKSQNLFYQNARPIALRVIGSDGSSEVYNLRDTFGGQRVAFKQPITVNKVKLVVERVAPGNKYEDTCIAEVNFF